MKAMSIEQFLRWCYFDEWPKAGARQGPSGLIGSDAALARWRADGSPEKVHDGVNRYGVTAFADDRLLGQPHPDADIAHAALMALDDVAWPAEPLFGADLGDGVTWTLDPRIDWPPREMEAALEVCRAEALREARAMATLRDARGALRMRAKPSGLVVAFVCVLRAPPAALEVDLDAVRKAGGGAGGAWFRRVREPVYGRVEEIAPGAFARPIVGEREVEVDGYDSKRRRPHPGAYRRLAASPDPAAHLARRAEWRLAMRALDVLALALAQDEPLDSAAMALALAEGRPETVRVTGRTSPDSPWLPGGAARRAA